ncbi:hypothetical protein [Flavobacterium sp.]|uniref:hypothetical protein n=1 Tax=Flavobacterium sp. TaxID=239 RepID=UPI00286F6B78|nr:hypothetical protein [Flavobacterium sp.]
MKTNLFLSTMVTLGCLSFANAQDLAVTKTGKLVTVNTPASTSAVGIVQLAGDLAGTSTSPEIGALKVTTAKLANDAVETIKIKDANVTTAKIADANVTAAKIAPGTANQVLTTNVGGVVVWAAMTATNNATETFTPANLQSSFTLANTPKNTDVLTIYRNGIATDLGGYTLTGAVVTLTTSDLSTADTIVFKYSY